MPSMTDTDSIMLGVAAFLFAFTLIALIAWAFKTFVHLPGGAARASCAGETAGSVWWRRHRSMDTAS
jgi:hypothetical protein